MIDVHNDKNSRPLFGPRRAWEQWLAGMGALLLLVVGSTVASAQPAPPPAHTALAETIIDRYAGMSLPDWSAKSAKVHAPRVAMAKLTRGENVAEVNAWLRRAEPWGNNGSTWFGHEGDYDFTLVTLTTLLHRFAADPTRLEPSTRKHLLDTLLTARSGEPRRTVPESLGFVIETENHVLMTEGSRYLRAQYLASRGDAKAAQSRAHLAAFLSGYLQRRIEQGFVEFHSIPYSGYTAQALLNLADFAADKKVRQRATALLDREAMRYAKSSLNFRRCVPFHRQTHYCGLAELREDPWASLMMVWSGVDADGAAFAPADVPRRYVAVSAALADYRPPADTIALARRKSEVDAAKWSHSAHLEPTIERHAWGPGWLISASRVAPDPLGRTIARPAVVLLRDGSLRVDRCIRILDDAPMPERAAVVGRGLLVATGTLRMPDRFRLVAESGRWRLHNLLAGGASETGPTWAAAWQGEDFAVIALLQRDDDLAPAELIAAVSKDNPDSDALRRRFLRPKGKPVGYKLRPAEQVAPADPYE